MPNRVMITPLTLYNIDNTVFDGISLPDYHFPRAIEYDDLFLKEGWTLDKEVLINNLLLECAELDTIYTNPEFFKFAVTQWAAKEYPVWCSLYETLFYKYNPIWNKDGTIKDSERQIRDLVLNNERTRSTVDSDVNNTNEFINDTDNTITNNNETYLKNNVSSGTKDNNNSANTSKSEIMSGIEVENNNSEKTGSNVTTTQVSAFDETTTWNNRDKVDNDTGETLNNERNKNNINNNTTTENQSGNNVESDNNVSVENGSNTNDGTNDRTYNRERSENGNNVHNGTETETNRNTDSGSITNNNERVERGNIGVVTTQAMISAERDLVKFNIYDFIIDSFKARFCILLY